MRNYQARPRAGEAGLRVFSKLERWVVNVVFVGLERRIAIWIHGYANPTNLPAFVDICGCLTQGNVKVGDAGRKGVRLWLY